MKVALITGITGQDGSYLADFLLEKEYYVYGIIRRSSVINTQRIDHIYDHPRLKLVYGDLSDQTNLIGIIIDIRNKHNLDPSNAEDRLEVYNLAAMSHVKVSFELPEYTGNIDGLGTLRLLEAIRCSGIKDITRFYQASTSEMFGKVQETPQKESTPFYPRSPYGVSKLYAHWITKNYRESYDMFACSGILFNHESPRRGETFVTRKVTRGLGMILRGESDKLVMGNINSFRDWGHARDYVKGMWLMLQADVPDDYVLATGEYYSVREFIEKVFAKKGFNIKWKGQGTNEIGYDADSGRELIFIDDKYYRPAEVDELLGDSTKAQTNLGWVLETSFEKLIDEMIAEDCP
jgi:GDPmannose 4,6-dehydratase